MTAVPIQPPQRSSNCSRLWIYLVSLISLCLLTHCTSTPPPSPLPPSASDLNVLGQAYLCQTKTEAQTSWLLPGSTKTAWGNGTEHFQEISVPNQQGQWLFFNKDETLVGVITVFPQGISLDNYPILQQTLAQLPIAREFYLTSSQLLEGQTPDSATLYRTGEANTTHQYYLRHRPGQDDQLIMTVLILDPYESLLDGAHHKFLAYLDTPPSQHEKIHDSSTAPALADTDFLGLQQFARGEIALFASCGKRYANIAQDAYEQAIHFGLSDTKQLAEAHHRLGLTLLHLKKLPEAKKSIEAALDIQPYAANILNSYGTVLINLKETQKGIQAFEKALALQPAFAKARFNLANVLESRNPKRAVQEYETFIVLAEDNPSEASRVARAKANIKSLLGE